MSSNSSNEHSYFWGTSVRTWLRQSENSYVVVVFYDWSEISVNIFKCFYIYIYTIWIAITLCNLCHIPKLCFKVLSKHNTKRLFVDQHQSVSGVNRLQQSTTDGYSQTKEQNQIWIKLLSFLEVIIHLQYNCYTSAIILIYSN